MTHLTFEPPGEHLFVRALDAQGIRIGDRHFGGSVILTPRELIENWPPRSAGEIRAEHLESLVASGPELVLLGTGARQVFLEPELAMVFHRHGVGIEVMTTEAACRTFNVLVAERREVIAGLLPLHA
jgi:uncharacterized protein